MFNKNNSSLKDLTHKELLKKVNGMQLELDTMKDIIKDELFTLFMEKLGEPLEIQRLKDENRNLRKQNKTLKEVLKGEK